MIILLLQKLFNEEQFDELAYLYIHEQEVITKQIVEEWLKNWAEKYEKELQTRSSFAEEVLMFLNEKKFELKELQKMKEKLNTLGFRNEK